MIPVDQQFLSDPSTGTVGDCVRACLASLLELEIDDVPHFVRDNPGRWRQAVQDWLRESYLGMAEVGGHPSLFEAPCYYLATGPSPRSPDIAHMCVFYNGELAHDPHPSRVGIPRIEHVYIIVPDCAIGD